MPLTADASLFYSIFGIDRASAQTEFADSLDNSQTLAILQPNISPLSMLDDKTEISSGDSGETNIVSETALVPATGPLGVSDGTPIEDFSVDQLSVYVVRQGDSISQIAEMFGVSINTVLAANDMKKSGKLTPGEILVILPISGLEHTVVKSETLQSIAKIYKVDVADITVYNDITEEEQLVIGDKLIIPGGEMMDEGGDTPAPNLGSSVARDTNYYATHPIRDVAGYFINPVPTGRKTQGLHGPGRRGIDIGAPTGTTIYASAEGTVLLAKSGCAVGYKRCGGGYGNYVIIQHPNGTKTLYGHMSKVGTTTGSKVEQGQVVGFVGSTGRSTGPHIHFEVFNAKNPGASWSWKN